MNIKNLFSFVFVAVPLMASAQITIDETNFPDTSFRNFLLQQSYGQDGVITEDEVSKITTIDVSDRGISNLKGIEYFTALTYLYCKNTLLATLDVSQNIALEYLECSGCELVALNISNNTALKKLSCNDNLLSVLDVSNNTALSELSCYNNQLASLDVSNNTALVTLSCYKNQLASLNITQNAALTNLSCYNNQLTSLDVSKNRVLARLLCQYNQLTSLVLSQNIALNYLNCSYNELKNLDLSNNTELTTVICTNNQLTYLNVTDNKMLDYLACSKNQLTSLDVSQHRKLKSLFCSNNLLTSLDVSNNTGLTYLYCYDNYIQGISMDNFINSLPTSTSRRELYIDSWALFNDNYVENNICTVAQVAKIQAKGWKIYNADGILYKGCDNPTIVSVSVGDEGLATYCPVFDVDFSHAKSVAAYKASVNEDVVQLTKVETVAAGEGVLLRSLNGGEVTEDLAVLEEATKNEDNAFVGTLEATILKETDGDATNFVLSNNDGILDFYKANDTPISAWKAYLPVKGYEASTKGVRIVFDDATGIGKIETSSSAETDAIYTLNGMRVANPTKGIYIKNGKKVVIK